MPLLHDVSIFDIGFHQIIISTLRYYSAYLLSGRDKNVWMTVQFLKPLLFYFGCYIKLYASVVSEL